MSARGLSRLRRSSVLVGTFAGTGTLTIDVRTGRPDAPAPGRVQLLSPAPSDGAGLALAGAVTEAWGITDAAGQCRFTRLQILPGRRYAVIAYDPTGQYDPVVKINLLPEPSPEAP